MKNSLLPTIFTMLLSLALVGCASSERRSTSASVPPAQTGQSEMPVEPESPGSTVSSSTTTTTETSVDVPTDTGKVIPIKDLPTKKGYPYAIKTKWPGLVKSPYAQEKTLVDVSTLTPGSPARCPHTGKIFIVP
jgi:hypothetical protein